jgi:hypothetical protein
VRVLSYRENINKRFIIFIIVNCPPEKDYYDVGAGEKRPRKKTATHRRRRVSRRSSTSGNWTVVQVTAVTTVTTAVTVRLRVSDTAEDRRRRDVAWFRDPEDDETGSNAITVRRRLATGAVCVRAAKRPPAVCGYSAPYPVLLLLLLLFSYSAWRRALYRVIRLHSVCSPRLFHLI